MPFKDLLVHLDDTDSSRHRLAFAAALARDHAAHLTGLYVLDLVPTLAALAHTYPGRIDRLGGYAAIRDAELEKAKKAETMFRDRLRRDALEGEWRFVEGLPSETVALHARYADLTVLGQIDPQDPPAGEAIRVPEQVLLTSGRPVLIIPYTARDPVLGKRVLVAWQPTREAARALGDALPLLERAAKVTVLTINPARADQPEPGIPAADIALHLARHDVRVEASTIVADDIASGDVLLNAVAETGADLLVMGGYGHSRAREFVLGGVTRQILQQMTVPVFAAH